MVAVESQFKRQFEAAAATKGKTMTAATETLMRLYISGQLDDAITKYEKEEIKEAVA